MYMQAHITNQDYKALAALLWREAEGYEAEARTLTLDTDTAFIEAEYRPRVEHSEEFDCEGARRYRMGFTDVTGHGFRITLAAFYDEEGDEVETDFEAAKLEALLDD